MNVLVSGGSGFLGRHVVAELETRGHSAWIPRSREYDLRRQHAAEYILDARKPEAVIHLAATVGGIEANRRQPGRFFYDNLSMGLNMIEASRKAEVKKFVLVGTVCSYPKYCPVPFSEEDLWNGYPEETNAPYGLAKRCLIEIGKAYRTEYGFPSIHLLPANLYGRGDSDDPTTSHVIPALIRKFFEAKATGADRVVVWGTGKATREFLHAADAAEGIVTAMERYDAPEPVNLGTGEEVSIADLAELIKVLVGFEGRIEFDPSKPDGQPRRLLDTSRAFDRFGWKARTGLKEGLQRLVQAMKPGGAWSGVGGDF